MPVKKKDDKKKTTTKTRKNILTGRTRTVTKTKATKGSKATKSVVVKRKDGTVAKTKHIIKGQNNRKNIVGGKKGKGSEPTHKTTTKFKKDGSSKTKNVSTKGKYDTRELKYADGTGKTSKKLKVHGGSVKSKRNVSKYTTKAPITKTVKKANASLFNGSKSKTYLNNDPRLKAKKKK